MYALTRIRRPAAVCATVARRRGEGARRWGGWRRCRLTCVVVCVCTPCTCTCTSPARVVLSAWPGGWHGWAGGILVGRRGWRRHGMAAGFVGWVVLGIGHCIISYILLY